MGKKVWKYKFVVSIGYHDADHEDTIEFDHEPTDEELNETLEDMRNNHDNSYYEPVKD